MRTEGKLCADESGEVQQYKLLNLQLKGSSPGKEPHRNQVFSEASGCTDSLFTSMKIATSRRTVSGCTEVSR